MKQLFLIILAIALYPYGACEAQTGGTTPGDDSCDTVYIDDPVQQEETRVLQQAVSDLTAQNGQLSDANDQLENENTRLDEINGNLLAEVAALNNTVADKDAIIASKDETIAQRNNEINTLQIDLTNMTADRDALAVQLEECLNKPAEMPSPTIDTIYITHANDDVTNRRFFIHGGMDAPYPKDITFESKEFCMVTVYFEQDVNIYREQAQFKVKRVRDHESATTSYFFIPE